jgi:hypothetical protein
MSYPSITIQGNIVSSETLDKIREEGIKFQNAGDFGLDRRTTVRDEIGMAWASARAFWTAFQIRAERLKEGDSGASETRNLWMLPLLRELGYDVEKATSYVHPDTQKTYAISHKASNLKGFPIHIMGSNDHLDRRRETSGPRLSPHALTQEYLNNTEHTYALVSNGNSLRLLRDATRLVRLSYLEFDLKKMMEEELYTDFALLFRLLHASRMPKDPESSEESPIELYHQESLASGSRIREKLSQAVEQSIKLLANGFLHQPDNEHLRRLVSTKQVTASAYYLFQLRLIYRFLFLIVTEERNLVYPDSKAEDLQRKRKIYYDFFSMERLRKMAGKLHFVDGRKFDLWEGIKTTFRLFENDAVGKKLGISPLGSGLFSPDALGPVANAKLDNESLLHVIRLLTFFQNDQGNYTRVNYSDLDVEEFGSVYEGLLEYDAVINETAGQPNFAFVAGKSRSSSGSHYTPEELVRPLIKHSLDYLIEDRLASGPWLVVSGGVTSGQLAGASEENRNSYIKIAPFETFKKLSGLSSLAEINGLSKNDVLLYKVLSERRDLWLDFANAEGSREYTSEHSGGPGSKNNTSVSSLSVDRQRLFSGSRDFDDTLKGIGISDTAAIRKAVDAIRRNRQAAERIDQLIAKAKKQFSQLTTDPWQLTTSHQPVEEDLLSLKVADVACGSGHILLSAARRIAFELACLRETKASNGKEKVEQPSPRFIRAALRDVIKHCIYGVDKNPLAVELCKVALWLEAHNPGEPLNFLDHHIKCGDAIVGLAHREELERGIADEAFKTLPGDDSELAATFRNRNKAERKEREANSTQLKAKFETETENVLAEAQEEYQTFQKMPEATPAEIERKARAYQQFLGGKGFLFLKAMADAQVAQFFIPKTLANKDYLLTDRDYRQMMEGHLGWQDQKLAKATAVAAEGRFFHWFLEFPEVFNGGGFDCILGNPPFLGGQKLSGSFGDNFLESIKYQFAPIGAVDLVTYFFRRIFSIIKHGGFQSLISTNTIAQGKAREDGLDEIKRQGGSINHAVKSMRWPGIAAVEVALVTLTKQKWKGKFILGGKEAGTITPYLDDSETLGNPFPLKQNEGKAFQGSIPLGKGFVLENNAAQNLISKNPKNRDVLFPYLNGDDLNNNPDQSSSRWVINFFDWPEDEAKKYPDCYQIVERLVKPERQRPDNNMGREKWWQFYRRGVDLYQTIQGMKKVIALCEVTKHLTFAYVDTGAVYTANLDIFAFKNWHSYSLIQNSLHYYWAWTYCAWLKRDLKYSPGNGFQTFPFPQNLIIAQKQQLEAIGEAYHEQRRKLMLAMQLGLTKTYNAFHGRDVQMGITTHQIKSLDKKAIEKQYGKEVWNLWNHLQKTPGTCSLEEAIDGIVQLRALHVKMDQAVLEAYGWQDIALRHDFYEVDYLPENDRVRYTIHPDARKEILKRLLELNHKIHEEEVKAGLWDKKKGGKKEKGKGPKIPVGGYGELFDNLNQD